MSGVEEVVTNCTDSFKYGEGSAAPLLMNGFVVPHSNATRGGIRYHSID
jgi:hypothetical protein